MAGSWRNALWFAIFTSLVYGLCACFNAGLLVSHLYYVQSDRKSHRDRGFSSERKHAEVLRLRRYSTICTVGALAAFALFDVQGTIARGAGLTHKRFDCWDDWQWPSCMSSIKVAGTIYALAKACMYCVFTFRLQIAYADSTYEYKLRTIFGLISIIVVALAFQLVGAVMYATGTVQAANSTGGEDVMWVCNQTSPFWLLSGSALYDTIISMVLLVMFVMPLRVMLKRSMSRTERSTRPSVGANDISNLPMKYTLVCSVAISSSMVGLVLAGAVRSGFFMAIDGSVNCACLVLLTAHWRQWYRCICSPLLRCVARVYDNAKWIAANAVMSMESVPASAFGVDTETGTTTGDGRDRAHVYAGSLQADGSMGGLGSIGNDMEVV